jgi:AcrR family transcriptional regulator
VCDAARITPPTLYHHFGDKDGLLVAVVDFGWSQFLEAKRATAAVVHNHIADDVRAGWDTHLEYARDHPNFYKLMWSPTIAARSAAVSEAYDMLHARLEVGARRGQLRVSAETATRMIMAAATGAAMSLITRRVPNEDDPFVLHLREAVISATTVSMDPQATSGRRQARDDELPMPTLAATLKSKLATQATPLAQAEQALMQQWLTTLADTPSASGHEEGRYPP